MDSKTTTEVRKKGSCESAAWGRLLLVLAVLAFAAHPCFGQGYGNPGSGGSHKQAHFHKLSPELQGLADQTKGLPASQSVRVIVQFTETPSQHHFDKVQSRGGRLGMALGLIKGGAFSVPVSALNTLAEDDDIAFIAGDHQISAADDLTSAAINLSAARNA